METMNIVVKEMAGHPLSDEQLLADRYTICHVTPNVGEMGLTVENRDAWFSAKSRLRDRLRQIDASRTPTDDAELLQLIEELNDAEQAVLDSDFADRAAVNRARSAKRKLADAKRARGLT